MRLELLQVARSDHAGDFDAQRWQRVRGLPNCLHHGLSWLIRFKIDFELFPAGDQLRRPTFHREVLHRDEVVFGPVRANENHFLGTGHQQLLLQLPVVMRIQITCAHVGGELLVPHFVLENDLAHHCAAVEGGQQVAFGAHNREQVFADSTFKNRTGQRFGFVTLVEQVLLDPPRNVPVEPGLLGMKQLGALHLLGCAHHHRCFRRGAIVGAECMPFGTALGDFMRLHAVSPVIGAIWLIRSI
ncbi:hypothetical protein PssB301D_02445 [Pseudomonas syringae pv. syringae str. B301D-R]|nr:hypothetical protein PssB301D_02445 [Pseudomonas syringae pv. syringae str. B301D-R]